MNRLRPFLMLSVLTASIALAARVRSPVPGLTVLPGDGLVKTGPSSARYRFGEAPAAESYVLKRSFTVRNDNPRPVEIGYVEVTCGCSSALLQTGAAPASGSGTPKSLAPGEKVGVQVIVDLGKLPPGPVNKFAYVYLQGREDPAASFEISGTLLPSVVFKPPAAAFGSRRFGSGESRRIAALLDSRLLTQGVRLTLVSSHPSVRVAPAELTSVERDFVSDRARLPAGLRKGRVTARAFTVSVSRDAPIGLLAGSLGFAPPFSRGEEEATASTTKGRITGALTKVELPLSGEIIGDVAASPPSLLFGTVAAGKGASRRVTLTGDKPEALEGLQLSGQGPWLDARIVPAAVRRKAVLQVAIRPTAPSSYLNERLTVSLRNGQRLVVPVQATITP